MSLCIGYFPHIVQVGAKTALEALAPYTEQSICHRKLRELEQRRRPLQTTALWAWALDSYSPVAALAGYPRRSQSSLTSCKGSSFRIKPPLLTVGEVLLREVSTTICTGNWECISLAAQIDERHGIWLGSEQTQGWIPPEREIWIRG